MNKSEIRITKLNSRLTLITEELPWVNFLSLGFVFETGSRDEDQDNNGITHFIEHMTFKGTEEKSAREITNILESLGVFTNGYTAKEEMVIYSSFLSHNFNRVVPLLISMLSNRKYKTDEVELERNVILQEIREIYDDPEDLLVEMFFEELFAENSLGMPVAGRINTVMNLTKEMLEKRTLQNWHNRRICISLAGRFDFNQVIQEFSLLPLEFTTENFGVNWSQVNKRRERIFKVIQKFELNQVYTIIGNYTIPLSDQRRFALAVLNHIIGSSRSSRLVRVLQDESGLVPYVSSFYELYSDIGIWGIFFITDSENYEKVLEIITKELKRLQNYGINKSEMERAINYRKGLLVMASEDPNYRMITNARSYLRLGRVLTLEDMLKSYDALTIDNLHEILQLLEPDRYHGIMLGPIKELNLSLIDNHLPKIEVLKFNDLRNHF
jgi:predicted Zn-dependent peptidase